MLKFGIYKKEQLLNSASLKGFFGGLKNISIDLYDQVFGYKNADLISQNILLSFSDKNGIYKRTYTKRFEILDDQVVKILQQQFVEGKPLYVHDIAVSDARTSCDLYEKLSQLNYELRFFASDYDPYITIVKKGRTTLALTNQGDLLQIVFPPFVFNVLKKESYLYYPLNHIVRIFVQYVLAPKIIRNFLQKHTDSRRVSLYCLKAQKLAKEAKNFHLLMYDLLQRSPFEHPFHVVRAMNVLNQSYFSQDNLYLCVRNIYNMLQENGLFITGSNQESNTIVNGSIYQKQGQRFVLIHNSGMGSPISSTIEGFLGGVE